MSGPAPRGRKKVHEEEHVNHERWLVSYADMITVLMALFIVLFAISQVDQEKYIGRRDTPSAGFQDTTSSNSILDGGNGSQEGDSVQTETNPASGTAGMVSADSGLGDQASNPKVENNIATSEAPAVDPAVLAAAQAEAAHLKALQDQIEASLVNNGLANIVRQRIHQPRLTL